MAGSKINIKDVDKERYVAVPLALFTQRNYAGLDNTARLIYGFLHSRLNLSRINKWVDAKGDIFFIAKISEMAAFFQLSKSGISKKMAMLEAAGLLERKKMGGRQPDHLYLCHIVSDGVDIQNNIQVPMDSSVQPSEEVINSTYGMEDTEFPAGNPEQEIAPLSLFEETQINSGFPVGNPEHVEFPQGDSGVSCGKPINTRNNIQQDNKNIKSINNNNKGGEVQQKQKNKSISSVQNEQNKQIKNTCTFQNETNKHSVKNIDCAECTVKKSDDYSSGERLADAIIVDVVSDYLQSIGMAARTTSQLLSKYGKERIFNAIKILLKQSNVHNPAGFLRRAIEENYQPSAATYKSISWMKAFDVGIQDNKNKCINGTAENAAAADAREKDIVNYNGKAYKIIPSNSLPYLPCSA